MPQAKYPPVIPWRRHPCYSSVVEFEWDPDKARRNWVKRGVSFDEATTVFGDPLAVTVDDPDHSEDEERFLTTGISRDQRTIIVSHTDRGGRVRLISARPTSSEERKQYEHGE